MKDEELKALLERLVANTDADVVQQAHTAAKWNAAVLTRMAQCGNPECTNCEATNRKLLQTAMGATLDLGRLVARKQSSEDELAKALAFAVMALGGTWVLDLSQQDSPMALELERDESEDGKTATYRAKVL